jgi:hypothetical protein
MSGDDIEKYIKKGTKVAFKFTVLEASNVHQLSVPDDVDGTRFGLKERWEKPTS